ncbi:MAG: 50S ribosomal protein L19e [Candidatus Hadarchaeia archaeon]
MNLENQKRMAAELLKVGKERVWIDPERNSEVSTAITKADIRQLINDNAIKAKPKKSVSRVRARKKHDQESKGRRSGPGRRKGSKGGRKPKKKEWMGKVRALRDELRNLRDEGTIDSSLYRDLYKRVKGGSFRSRAHLRNYLKERGLLGEEDG